MAAFKKLDAFALLEQTPAADFRGFSRFSNFSRDAGASDVVAAMPLAEDTTVTECVTAPAGISADPAEATDKLSAADYLPDEFEERAALVEEGAGAPREWAEAFAGLDPDHPPKGVPLHHWRALVDHGGRFLDRWCAEAVRLGWTVLDVFGAHPAAPDARHGAKGIVWFLGEHEEVIGIGANAAKIRTRAGSVLVYRRHANGDGPAVPVWELVR